MMDLRHYRAERNMLLTLLIVMRMHLRMIKRTFPSLNHTELRRFGRAHVKPVQVRLHMLRVVRQSGGSGERH